MCVCLGSAHKETHSYLSRKSLNGLWYPSSDPSFLSRTETHTCTHTDTHEDTDTHTCNIKQRNWQRGERKGKPGIHSLKRQVITWKHENSVYSEQWMSVSGYDAHKCFRHLLTLLLAAAVLGNWPSHSALLHPSKSFCSAVSQSGYYLKRAHTSVTHWISLPHIFHIHCLK